MITKRGVQKLLEATTQFHGKKVLVVGDIGLDRYIHGISTRLCPEAPVPVFIRDREEFRAGLAGNVAANVASLGGQVRLCSLIGDDQFGVDLFSALEAQGIQDAEKYIARVTGGKTTVKARYYVGRQMLLREDSEGNDPYMGGEFRELIAKSFKLGVVKEIREWADVVVIQDYGKGLITRDLTGVITEACVDRKLKILVDPSPKNSPTLYSGCHYLKPNASELDAMLTRLNYGNQVTYAYDQFADLLSCQGLVITQGSAGMLVETRDRKEHISAMRKEVFDVCGAGDTVTAAMALSLACGLDLFDSAFIGNAAASVVVGKFGTATVSYEELTKILQEAEYGSGNQTNS